MLTLLDHGNGGVAISPRGMRVEIDGRVLDALLQAPRCGKLANPHPDHAAGVQQPDGFRYQGVLAEPEDLLAHEEAILGATLEQVLVQFLADLLGLCTVRASPWKKKKR